MIVALDTSAYTALAQNDEGFITLLEQAEHILISSIVVGELEYGFQNGSRSEQNRASLNSFLAEHYVEFLPPTRDMTLACARIVADLRKRGRKIPTNDMWIAAHSIERDAELLSKDKHTGT